jgi:hypothetical protein
LAVRFRLFEQLQYFERRLPINSRNHVLK